MSETVKGELMRLAEPRRGKSDIRKLLIAAGFKCRILGYRSDKWSINAAQIILETPWTDRDVLINFCLWAYANWKIRGSFDFQLKPADYYVVIHCNETLSIRVNHDSGAECSVLEGVASADYKKPFKWLSHVTGKMNHIDVEGFE